MREFLFEGNQVAHQVVEHFESLGFEDICLYSNWRHIVGSVTRNNQPYFLKLATTIDVAQSTQNEYGWNMLMKPRLGFLGDHITIPTPYDQGNYHGLFWFTSQFVYGEPLAHPQNPNHTYVLEQNLDLIARTACNIMLITTNESSAIPNMRPCNQELDSIFSRLENWLITSHYRATDVLERLKLLAGDVTKSPTHGDYVPWHILTDRSGLAYLVDGEHATLDGYKFYDIAYCYHRIYTKFKRPDIANNFLKRFQAVYNTSDPSELAGLYWMIGQRIIGGYLDVSSSEDKFTSIELQHELRESWLASQLY